MAALVCVAASVSKTLARPGSSFTLVPYVSRLLVDTFGWSSSSSLVTAQLFTPCAAQLINTPFYLYGLSLHNSPTHSMAERRAFIGREYTKVQQRSAGQAPLTPQPLPDVCGALRPNFSRFWHWRRAEPQDEEETARVNEVICYRERRALVVVATGVRGSDLKGFLLGIK